MTTRLLFRLFLPNAPAHLLGDLEEESHSHSRLWLFRHILTAALHQSNLLETAAATSFLLGLPLIVILELRRSSLTLIPYRESAAFTTPSLLLIALAVALLTSLLQHALPKSRLTILLATTLTALISALTATPQLLTAAALLGGTLAMQRKTP
jgi:hypothetical protein